MPWLKINEMNRKNQALLLLLIILIAIPSYLIYDYTQNNPKFCTTCHLMNDAYDTWQASAMHELNCHECHETDMIESMGHVYEVLLMDPNEVTKMTEIDNELCINCHASNSFRWRQVISTDGHKVHFFEKQEQPACISCHGLNLHVFEPLETLCEDCHEEENWMYVSGLSIHCIDCHEFSSTSLFPDSEDCINCHDFTRTNMIKLDSNHQKVEVETYCMSCHNPHSEDIFENCTSCHSESSGLHEVSSHKTCSFCHNPHTRTRLRETCLTCHADKKTHYSITKCEICHSFIS